VTVGDKVVWQGLLRPAQDNQAMISGIELPPGDTTLLLKSDRPAAVPGNGDLRPLTFSIRNLKIKLNGRR
jgi:hypothetical protein